MTLSPARFEYVRALIRQRTGNALGVDKAYLVETRLLPLAREQGFGSVEAFLSKVQAGALPWLLAEICEQLLIHETLFFRDGKPFELLRDEVLPHLLDARRQEKQLRIWSAACSTGQEPYSVAMLLQERAMLLPGWDLRVIASDISAPVVEQAREGAYNELQVARGLSVEQRARWLRQRGGTWTVADDVRRLVEFRVLHLAGVWPELPEFDLVLLRNVLIYFDPEMRRDILLRVRDVVRQGGLVLLGGGENLLGLDVGLTQVCEWPGYFRVT